MFVLRVWLMCSVCGALCCLIGLFTWCILVLFVVRCAQCDVRYWLLMCVACCIVAVCCVLFAAVCWQLCCCVFCVSCLLLFFFKKEEIFVVLCLHCVMFGVRCVRCVFCVVVVRWCMLLVASMVDVYCFLGVIKHVLLNGVVCCVLCGMCYVFVCCCRLSLRVVGCSMCVVCCSWSVPC